MKILPFAKSMSTFLTRHDNHGALAGFIAGAIRCFKVENEEHADALKVWEYFMNVFQCQDRPLGPDKHPQFRPEELPLSRMIRWARDRNPGDWKPELGPIPNGGIPTVKVMADITIRCWNSYATQEPFDLNMPVYDRRGFKVTEAVPSNWDSSFLDRNKYQPQPTA